MAINQQVPAWPANVRVVSTKGVLELLINPKGEVEAATMRVHMHPAFDTLVLERAKTWKYRPAVRGAQPVTYLKRIEIEAKQAGPDAAR